MAKLAYHKETAALLVVDPYNDFISEGGKIWDCLKAVAEANQCVPNMLRVLNALATRRADKSDWRPVSPKSSPSKSPLEIIRSSDNKLPGPTELPSMQKIGNP